MGTWGDDIKMMMLPVFGDPLIFIIWPSIYTSSSPSLPHWCGGELNSQALFCQAVISFQIR